MHTPITMPTPNTLSSCIKAAFEFDCKDMPFHASETAPNKYSDLLEYVKVFPLFEHSLPVYEGGCEKTIFENPEDNHMFRAWHDYLHVTHSLSFQPSDELKVSEMHCLTLRAIGAPYNVIKALEADVAGQVQYYQLTGEFVKDQKTFVTDCLQYSIQTTLSFVKRGLRY